MEFLKRWFSSRFPGSAWPGDPDFDPWQLLIALLILVFWLCITVSIIYSALHSQVSLASTGTSLPGDDASGKLEAAGILLKTLDTGIFKWGARIFAGICIMSSAWALKEQRFGIAIICVIGAIIFGTAPKWVQNIFDVGGNQGLFSKAESKPKSISIADIDHLGVNRYV
jgi:hypothetical protein